MKSTLEGFKDLKYPITHFTLRAFPSYVAHAMTSLAA